MLTKNDVTIGIEWRFGPDWPGQRCGARTRKGTACLSPAIKRNGRCRLHGGASTGPKTIEGRARISLANLRHGKYTKDKIILIFCITIFFKLNWLSKSQLLKKLSRIK